MYLYCILKIQRIKDIKYYMKGDIKIIDMFFYLVIQPKQASFIKEHWRTLNNIHYISIFLSY